VTIVFYVSGHGFGHSVRQIAIINALGSIAPPDLRIVVRTSAPEWLFKRNLNRPFELVPGETDAGVVQIDGLRLDERSTIEAATGFYGTLPQRIEHERSLLESSGARLVVADAPPLGIVAARRSGIPGVVCANFTWDWIYREYTEASPDGRRLVDALGSLYANASGAWRLPLHGGFETIDPIVDVPLVARHASASHSRPDTRRALELPEDARLALVSFGGFGVRALPLDRLDCLKEWRVVVTAPGPCMDGLPQGVHGVPEDLLYGRGFRYEDLVRSVDAVITKPGYGIIADCIANQVSMLYTARGRFAEYEVLVREAPRFLRCRYLSMEDFLAGRWRQGLDALIDSPAPPEGIRTDGAQVIARLILDRMFT
jgi:hypothetical protein